MRYFVVCSFGCVEWHNGVDGRASGITPVHVAARHDHCSTLLEIVLAHGGDPKATFDFWPDNGAYKTKRSARDVAASFPNHLVVLDKYLDNSRRG
jgi:hypothetical protein